MKFQIMSDLHIGFKPMSFPSTPAEAEVLIIAGDIESYGDRMLKFLHTACDRYQYVVMLCGNHEYYNNRTMDNIDAQLRLFPRTNFNFLQKDVITIGGIRIAGCTLWSDTAADGPIAAMQIELCMNDYNYIHIAEGMYQPHGGFPRRKTTLRDLANVHADHVAWLKEQQDIDIVVTHHAPSWQSVMPEYKNDMLNAAYATNLDYLVRQLEPAIWVHGHMHKAQRYEIGKTTILCNPRGYQGGGLHEASGFDENFIVEVFPSNSQIKGELMT